jgi:hypothetical protein
LIVLIINAHPARRGARTDFAHPAIGANSEQTSETRATRQTLTCVPGFEIERRHLHEGDQLLQAWKS